MSKFQRDYYLSIQDVDKNTVIIEPPFTIEFDFKKEVFSNTSQGQITIYNLSETVRNSIFKDIRNVDLSSRREIEFKAGYTGNLSRIFKGSVSRCYSMRQGVNILTIIEMNSGSDFIANSYITADIGEGESKIDALAKLAKQLNPDGARYIGNFEGSFRRAVTLAGSAEKLIKDYSNGNFYIDNDDIYILNDTDAINGVLNEIDSDSGLLGSPKREESFLDFDMIFEPRILMGQKIKLTSEKRKLKSPQALN